MKEDDLVEVIERASGLELETEATVAPEPPCRTDAVYSGTGWKVSIEAKQQNTRAAWERSIEQCDAYSEAGWPAYAVYPRWCVNSELVNLYRDTEHGLLVVSSEDGYSEVRVHLMSSGRCPDFEHLVAGSVAETSRAYPGTILVGSSTDADWREELKPVVPVTGVLYHVHKSTRTDISAEEAENVYGLPTSMGERFVEMLEAYRDAVTPSDDEIAAEVARAYEDA